MKKPPLILIPLLCQLSKADNIAPSGTGIIGIHTAIDGTLGTPYVRTDQPDGTTVRINDAAYGTDGSFDAVIDTWNGDTAASDTFAYYGVTGMTIPAGQEITNLTVNLITANGTPGATPPTTTFTGNPNEDLDLDGLSALVEYALGTNDNTFDSSPPYP